MSIKIKEREGRNEIMLIDSKKVIEALENIVFKYQNENDTWIKEDNELCRKCANFGWLVPYFIEDEDYNNLKLLSEESEITNFFKDYFENKNYKNIFYMVNDFANNNALINFQKAYIEAYKSFINNNYIVTTITLISIFEGICVEFILENEQTQNIKGDINRYVNEKYKNRKELSFNDREALKIFVESLFKSIRINTEDDNIGLNRNIIMHGRNFNNIGKLEAMKMFNAIGVLVELIELNTNDI